MKLTLDYLKQRHYYWRFEIGKHGIWNPDAFDDILFSIRKNHKRYNAFFQRKSIKTVTGVRYEDKIVIYNKVEDFDELYLDSLLVHEMIHQYLVQNNLQGSRPHGLPFKNMMAAINHKFKGRLNVQLKSLNPSISRKGPGEKQHTLLIIIYEKEFLYCVVNPNKVYIFEAMLKREMKSWKRIKNFFRAESNDVYFNLFPKCTKVLSGKKLEIGQLVSFLKEYDIKRPFPYSEKPSLRS